MDERATQVMQKRNGRTLAHSFVSSSISLLIMLIFDLVCVFPLFFSHANTRVGDCVPWMEVSMGVSMNGGPEGLYRVLDCVFICILAFLLSITRDNGSHDLIWLIFFHGDNNPPISCAIS